MIGDASTSAPGLPVRLDSLIGRREELSLIRRLLQTSARAVTITGAAGVGKSRVAIAAAESLKRSVSGVWYVDVSGSGGQVAAAVAHELKVDSGEDALSAVTSAIGESDCVLLLDGVDEAVAETTAFVDVLLTSCPGARLIVTGREPIASAGNALVALGPLGARDLTASSDAVGLFADRAASADARFAVDESTLPQVIRICAATGGVPLAIELAAAQLQFLDVRTLAKRMDRQLRTLEPSGSAYRSLRAAVEDSWERCGPAERRVWTDLSVLAPGWDLELGEAMAALSVSEPDSATAVVKQLIRRSIVHRRRIEGGVRYELLPALREFGEERLQNPPEVQRHFVTCMIQRLHDAEDNWFSGRQAETLRRLRGDIPNIRRAVKTAAALGDTDRAVEVVVTGWRQAFQIHGSEDELANWVAIALQTGTPSPRWAALGHALMTAIFSRSGKPGLATTELERAAAARDILLSGDDSDTARTCDAAVRSAAETLERDDGEAAILLRSLLDELGEDAYRFGPMNIPQRLAARLYALGETEAADAVGSAIVERAVAVGDRFERSFLLTTRATAAAAVGDYETTEAGAREALVLKRGLGNGLGVAQALELLADVARERSDPVRSARLLGAAAARWREAGALRGNYPPYFYDRDRTERAVRHRLGDPAFDRAFGYGAALSEGESIEFALHRIVEAHGRAGVPSVPGGSPLTPRETQVATLVADGASNKEMARRLFVSIRTIETHVQNALVKLGLRSRTELALWYREHPTRR